MSNLSAAECTAGISRAALATRKNGHAVPAPSNLAAPGRPPVKTAVLDTWCHSLDLLNINGFSFAIRDTQHMGPRVEVTTIHFQRHELETLAAKIREVLSA